ncbi:MAG TPA: hypothetical protein VM056_00085 [Terriglobales bacterium]|nr:hypothetical protein [Terriglobales bacterium]
MAAQPKVTLNVNFAGKTFRVVRNDGPDAEVTAETVFTFQQEQRSGLTIVHADYSGGGVVFGKLVGVWEDDKIRHSYVQLNRRGEFHRGNGTDEIKVTPEGKIQLIDTWKWETKEGSGLCILEEM